jgi:hypothetical protein
MGQLTVRPFRASDEAEIRRIFRQTVGLGQPLPFAVPGFARYEALCLDWYLSQGARDAAVAVGPDGIVGYALVCTDATAYRRWARRRAALFAATIAPPLAMGRYPAGAARFYRLRLRDGWAMWRHGVPDPLPAHAHFNLVAGTRAGWAGHLLVDHIDQRCRLAGLPGWFGEINAVAGRRVRALERLGATIVHRVPNRTLSWLAGQPVERLTVARALDHSRRRLPSSSPRAVA